LTVNTLLFLTFKKYDLLWLIFTRQFAFTPSGNTITDRGASELAVTVAAYNSQMTEILLDGEFSETPAF